MKKVKQNQIVVQPDILGHPLLKSAQDIGVYLGLLAFPDLSQRILAQRLCITRQVLRRYISNFRKAGLIPSLHDLSKPEKEEVTQTTVRMDSKIDYAAFMAFFNQVVAGTNIPSIKIIDDERKAMLNARCSQWGKEAVIRVVHLAVLSDFLCGNNEKGFTASFDWLFRPRNFKKTLEGTYNNRQNGFSKQTEEQQRLGEFAQHIADKLVGGFTAGCQGMS